MVQILYKKSELFLSLFHFFLFFVFLCFVYSFLSNILHLSIIILVCPDFKILRSRSKELKNCEL